MPRATARPRMEIRDKLRLHSYFHLYYNYNSYSLIVIYLGLLYVFVIDYFVMINNNLFFSFISP